MRKREREGDKTGLIPYIFNPVFTQVTLIVWRTLTRHFRGHFISFTDQFTSIDAGSIVVQTVFLACFALGQKYTN